MNLRVFEFYGFICFFPIWVFRSNLEIDSIISNLIFFFIIPLIFHHYIFKFLIKKFFHLFIFWISFISFYGFDQNLGLWNIYSKGTLFLNLSSPYYFAFFNIILSLSLIFIFIKLTKYNGVKILLSSIVVIFFSNLLDQNKFYSNFPKKKIIGKENLKKYDNSKKIVIIFDEMSGLNSEDSKVKNGKAVDDFILNFFKKNNFDIYHNAYSLFRDTDKSLSSLLNFVTNQKNFNINNNFMEKSPNYFIEKNLKKNQYFDLDVHQNIIVTQSMYINFCNHKKVIICNQFNPYNKKLEFLDGFKNTPLSRNISYFRNNGSVISYFVWRMLLEYRFIDSFLDPGGEKATINYIFDNMVNDIQENKNSTLFYSHILVPHIPFTYDENCNFDGNRSINYNRLSVRDKRLQHNLEKKCTILFLEIFFKKLKKLKKFDEFEIIVFSDHDSRIVNSKKISNKVIFMHKRKKSTQPIINYKDNSINEIIKKISD